MKSKKELIQSILQILFTSLLISGILLTVHYYYPFHIDEQCTDIMNNNSSVVSQDELAALHTELAMYKDLCHRMQLTIREMWNDMEENRVFEG